jgi:putative NADH-flavin reductase
MRFVVFGASGGTGQELLRQGVSQGHEVTAFVRDPKTVTGGDRLSVVVGDALDPRAVALAVTGQAAVVSALGSRSLGDATLLPESMVHILSAMRQHNVRRLIVLGASGAFPGADKNLALPSRILLKVMKATFLKKPFQSQRAMQELVRMSDTDWTVVQPPRLLTVPAKGTYRVAEDALPAGGRQIARADVAAFMLEQLTSAQWVRKSPFIAW